jgi:hypothetical protein
MSHAGMSDPPPPFRFSRESRIRIDPEGRVWHEGERVLHEGLARALASWVDFDDATGRYVMRNPLDWCFITVDRTPLVVRRIIPRADAFDLELSDHTVEPLRREHLLVAPDGALFTYVRGGTLLAGFDRASAFALLEHAVPAGDGFALPLGGRVAPIAALAEGEIPPPRPAATLSTSAGEGATRSPAP